MCCVRVLIPARCACKRAGRAWVCAAGGAHLASHKMRRPRVRLFALGGGRRGGVRDGEGEAGEGEGVGAHTDPDAPSPPPIRTQVVHLEERPDTRP